MTKMDVLARELRDALDNLPLSTKKLSEMFRKHGDKNNRSTSDLTDLDNRLAATGKAILDTPKGDRPDPGDYLPESYIAQHVDQFEGGVSRFQGQQGYDANGPFRTDGDGLGFVLPSSEVERILGASKGDIGVVEKMLGLPSGTLGDGPLVVVDFPNAKPGHLTMPSGNETGANDLWLPYGEMPSGVPEAVLHVDSSGAVGHTARVDDDGDLFTFGRR